uniref:Uncharacterized protein n=1 Tax=uncultured organism MedDCM-OCT-S04-C478 TaxID=743617 RepID=D6PK25_9ZZZZ|nr:hypothetical protein [uncultured organism MedDCM-OCT-S04-C478]
MQFELPRRQRKSFEAIAKSSLSDKFNKEQAIDTFNKIKKNTKTHLILLVRLREKRSCVGATRYCR